MAAHLFRLCHTFCVCLVAQPRRTFVVLFARAAHLFRFLHAFCACLVAQPRRTFVVLFARAAHLFRFLHTFCVCLVAQPRCTFVVLFARAAHLFRFLRDFCACLVAQPHRMFVVLFSASQVRLFCENLAVGTAALFSPYFLIFSLATPMTGMGGGEGHFWTYFLSSAGESSKNQVSFSSIAALNRIIDPQCKDFRNFFQEKTPPVKEGA